MQKSLSLSLSLSLSVSLCVSLSHTQHTCSHFFVQEKGENIKKFRDIEKQQGQRQKRIWESALLIIWLTSSFVWYWKKERKKVLTWDGILLLAQNRIFSAINFFIQSKKKPPKKQGFEEEKILLSGFKTTRDKHQSLFHLSLDKKEIVGPCAKITTGEVVLLEIFFFFFATDYRSEGGGGRRVVPKSATRPKIRPRHNHPLHQPR